MSGKTKAKKSSDTDDPSRDRRPSSAGSEDSNGDQNNDDDDEEDYSLNHQCESLQIEPHWRCIRCVPPSFVYAAGAFTFPPY